MILVCLCQSPHNLFLLKPIIAHKHYISTFLSAQQVCHHDLFNRPTFHESSTGWSSSVRSTNRKVVDWTRIGSIGSFFLLRSYLPNPPYNMFLNINNQLLPLSLRISIAYQQSYACRVQEVCRHESC